MTGGRIKRAKEYVGDEPFMLTYGDGVADININELIQRHKDGGKYCTMTAVRPSGRFGALGIEKDGTITTFHEKPEGDGNWINGGFMVCEPKVFDYISGDSTTFENEPLENLAKEGQLNAYKHYGFWKSMDTISDKNQLTEMWVNNKAPWTIWQ